MPCALARYQHLGRVWDLYGSAIPALRCWHRFCPVLHSRRISSRSEMGLFHWVSPVASGNSASGRR